MPVPKGLEPTGVILADKPAGPSSFAIVARVRSRTGTKMGHAGTLDPFATGLLVLLSGRSTKLAGSSCRSRPHPRSRSAERAYKLHRRGVDVEMPLRRSQVHALDVIAYTDGV